VADEDGDSSDDAEPSTFIDYDALVFGDDDELIDNLRTVCLSMGLTPCSATDGLYTALLCANIESSPLSDTFTIDTAY